MTIDLHCHSEQMLMFKNISNEIALKSFPSQRIVYTTMSNQDRYSSGNQLGGGIQSPSPPPPLTHPPQK